MILKLENLLEKVHGVDVIVNDSEENVQYGIIDGKNGIPMVCLKMNVTDISKNSFGLVVAVEFSLRRYLQGKDKEKSIDKYIKYVSQNPNEKFSKIDSCYGTLIVHNDYARDLDDFIKEVILMDDDYILYVKENLAEYEEEE